MNGWLIFIIVAGAIVLVVVGYFGYLFWDAQANPGDVNDDPRYDIHS